MRTAKNVMALDGCLTTLAGAVIQNAAEVLSRCDARTATTIGKLVTTMSSN